jgi:hypothetical protein
MFQKIFLWIAVTVLLVSCSAAPQVSPVTPSEDKNLPTAASADEGLILTYQRSGGIMGISDSWKIYADGRVEAEKKGTKMQVSAESVRALKDLLLRADIAALSKATKTPSACADCFNISITLNDEGEVYTLGFIQDGRSSAQEEAIAAALATFIQDAGQK